MSSTVLSRLDSARRDLLDLGLRNALVNHASRARQVRVVDERAAEIHRILVREARMMTFEPLAEERANQAVADADDPAARVEELDWDTLLAQPEDTGESPAQRHTDNRLQTALTSEALLSRLLSIHNDARGYIEEQGVNILFLALGFLHWYEAPSSNEARRAPLLLIPVTLERASARERFQLRWSEADIGDNLSLAEKLRAEFGLKLPPIGDPEEFDLPRWMAAVSDAVAGMPRWKVAENEVSLGFFSFGKFQMYADLDPARWGERPLPPVLPALLETGFRDGASSVPDSANLDEVLSPADIRQVKDADSSQLLAILDVMRGRNLVLQGPPGTGKSQTITNIIAESIGAGRKVLFVAEKMAALDVVKRRLDECGLGDAVLELHSHKSKKKDVLAELRRTLEQGQPLAQPSDEDITVLTRLRDRLNAYSDAVNRPIGATRQSFIGALGKAIQLAGGRDIPDPLPFAPMQGWTDAQWRERRMTVEAMDRHLAVAGAPADSPFPTSGLLVLLPSEREALTRQLNDLREITAQVLTGGRALAGAMSLPMPDTIAAAGVLVRAARRAMTAPHLTGITLRSGDWQLRRDELSRLLAAGRALTAAHAAYDERLIDEAWRQDLVAVREAWVTWGGRWWRFLSGSFRAAQGRMRGLSRGALPGDAAEVLAMIDAVLDAQTQQRVFDQHAPLGRALFGAQWKDRESDWEVLATLSDWIVGLYRDVGDGTLPEGIIGFLSGSPALDRLAGQVETLESLIARYTPAAAAVTAGLALPEGDESVPGTASLLEALIARLDRWIAGIDLLDERVRYNVLARQCEEEGLQDLLARCSTWRAPAGELTRLFDYSWHAGLVASAYQQSREIQSFDRIQHELAREQFGKLDHLLFQHNRAHLALAHWQQLPSPDAAGEMAIVRAEINKQRRILPIRSLIEKAGRAVQAIKPVFMMGPMSVATYLAPGAVEFDLVVFDEASQVKPADAFGALMRARQAVVVGDSKQLPPTSFFDSLTEGTADPDDAEDPQAAVGDMESVLSLFLGRGAPERMLRWHYRSRHHSLIAVSNHEFYENRLVVFPSPGGAVHARGLRLRYCPDTLYDRGKTRTNPAEARLVAEAVMEHARDFPDLSLGVVAFSVAQRDAIEMQLERLRRENASCEPFFSGDTREPFFVKNLENVQGDERDVIFISVGYGRADRGYMAMNFGPLNRDGGERRLNVLISRSRLAMDVFCNFRAEDIDLARSNARALVSLRNFLSYAEHGRLDTPTSTGREPDSPFEQSVLRALAARGHVVEPQVGSAGFFIDIGVRDPEVPGRYLLGIECDGAAYHSSRSARDRDRLRQEVLEGLGWRLHRIWSTDWFRHPQRELERTEAAIATARAFAERAAPEQPPAAPTAPQPQAPTAPAAIARSQEARTPQTYPAYTYANVSINTGGQQLHELPAATLSTHICAIVQIESPVHRDELARRITEAAGLKRAGSRIQQAVDAAITHAARAGTVVRKADYVWAKDMTDPPVRDRSAFDANTKKIELVAPEEIAAALLAEIRRGFSMDTDTALIAAARALGFQRLAAPSRDIVLAVLRNLIDAGQVNRNGDLLTA